MQKLKYTYCGLTLAILSLSYGSPYCYRQIESCFIDSKKNPDMIEIKNNADDSQIYMVDMATSGRATTVSEHYSLLRP